MYQNLHMTFTNILGFLLKPTTPKNCIFMPFLDTNSYLTTKPYNFDIKCKSNSESYDWHSFFRTMLRGGQNLVLTVGGFINEREYSGADWLGLLLINFCLKLHKRGGNFDVQQSVVFGNQETNIQAHENLHFLC